MAEAAAPPGSIRMTVSSESPTSKEEEKPGIKKKQWKPWFEFEERDREYGIWATFSALVFIFAAVLALVGSSFWPVGFYGVLIVFAVYVIVQRIMNARRADPSLQTNDVVKSGFMSLFLVFGGYVSGFILVILFFSMLLSFN